MKTLDKITEYFSKEMNYSETDQLLFRYGLDVIAGDVINYISLFLMSCFLHMTPETFIYIISFSFLRSYAGGWHADTRMKCLIVYWLHYLCTVFIYKSDLLSPIISIVVFFLSAIYILVNAPVQHPRQPLTDGERLEAQRMAILLIILYSFLIFVAIVLHSTLYRILVCVTVYAAYTMLILKKTNGESQK